MYISDITEFDRMFKTNQGNVTPETITRYRELQRKENNIFYSYRMGGNITLLVDQDANNFGRKYVLEFLNGYVQKEEILEKIEDYIVYPGLGDEAGFVGSIALGKIALENNRK